MVLVFVKQANGTTISIDANIKDSVKRFKKLIAKTVGASVRKQKLLFGGQLLQNDKTLSEYNVTKECMIQLVITKSDSKNHSNQNKKHHIGTAVSKQNHLQQKSSSTSQDGSVASSPRRSHAATFQRQFSRNAGANLFLAGNSTGSNHHSPHLHFGDLILVKLIEAKALKKSDFWTDSSDPYCLIVLNNDIAKSKVIPRNVNPQWNQVKYFICCHACDLFFYFLCKFARTYAFCLFS